MGLRREGRSYEVFRYLLVFVTAEQDTVGAVESPSRATHLLIVVDRRAGPLVVDHEAKIWLIEAHTKGRGRNEGLDLIGEKLPFEFLALFGVETTPVCVSVYATRP